MRFRDSQSSTHNSMKTIRKGSFPKTVSIRSRITKLASVELGGLPIRDPSNWRDTTKIIGVKIKNSAN